MTPLFLCSLYWVRSCRSVFSSARGHRVQISLMALMLKKTHNTQQGLASVSQFQRAIKGGSVLPHGHGLGGAVVRDKVVGNGAHRWLDDLGWDVNVARLRGDGQDLGDILLVRLVVLLQERVEVKQQELMHGNQARDEVHHCESDFELLVRFAKLGKHLLSEA